MEATTKQRGDISSVYPDSQGFHSVLWQCRCRRESIFIPIDILIDIGAETYSTLVDMCVLGDSSTRVCLCVCVCAPMRVEARGQMSSSVLLYFYFYYFIYEFNLLVYFRGSASLCSPGCSGTHYVDQAVLKLNRSPASAGVKGMYSHHA